MGLIDQYAIANVRTDLIKAENQKVWDGPKVSGFLFNVSEGAASISINTTPTCRYVLYKGDCLGVKDVTMIQALPGSAGGEKIAYVLFYSGGNARLEEQPAS